MIQRSKKAARVIDAAKKSGRSFQVGSQYASALSFQKIGSLLKSGAIGVLNMVEAWLDRNTADGAWQYSIPPDATPQTVDGPLPRQRSKAALRADPAVPVAQLPGLRHPPSPETFTFTC